MLFHLNCFILALGMVHSGYEDWITYSREAYWATLLRTWPWLYHFYPIFKYDKTGLHIGHFTFYLKQLWGFRAQYLDIWQELRPTKIFPFFGLNFIPLCGLQSHKVSSKLVKSFMISVWHFIFILIYSFSLLSVFFGILELDTRIIIQNKR